MLYEATQDITAAIGMPAYEVSNHARPGAESRHNLTYWRYGDYAGIGPAPTGAWASAMARSLPLRSASRRNGCGSSRPMVTA